MKKALLLLIMTGAVITAFAQSNKSAKKNHAYRDTTALAANRWVDKQLAHMSLEERIGQLLFVRVPQTMTKKQRHEFEKNFTKHAVGGVCFFKGTAPVQLERTMRYQRLSRVPLFVTIDGEWGLGMRLTDCYSFPRQMLMGALSAKNDTLIARFGHEVALQCRKMGIHINFAPVCDINNNPANPVIGCRSFGENKKRVARKSAFYARAMQRDGIIAVGKHFPGHGDTDVDSHLDLPVINHTAAYIDSVDLFPFRHLVKNGIRGMMVAHLQVNALDDRKNMPSSLSERIVTPLLREQMHFDGLIITDGIDMKAVSNNYKDGEGAIRAIRAGADVILLPIDVDKTINALLAEARRDKAFEKLINDRCRRILKEKYRIGLNKIDLSVLSVPDSRDAARCAELTTLIASKALTLVRNDNALPLSRNQKIVNVAVGRCDTAIAKVDNILRRRMEKADAIVISLYATISPSNNYGISKNDMQTISTIASLPTPSVLVIYGSPYILNLFPAAQSPQPDAVVMAYQNMKEVIDALPPALYGESQFEGLLPVAAGGYREGTSLRAVRQPAVDKYEQVKKAGLDVGCFRAIDSIAERGIKLKAYPGCQILVAKDGNIVFNRCYGRQTYDANSPAVDTTTVYDLASLTKITATTLAVMKLVDAGKVSLDDHLSKYLPYLKHTDKRKITVRQALSHCARLKAFDAYWKAAVADSTMLYAGDKAPDGFMPVGDSLFVSPALRDNILEQIVDSKLEKKNQYLYSDLGFILLAEMVQHISGQSLDIFMQQHFYQPLGMHSTTFCPLQNGIPMARIAPTEVDNTFRQQLIRGYVHDPNAAAMGGVAGHAGLFSTANDLFLLCQMMLDSGRYDTIRYVSPQTFNLFNHRHFTDINNRRALGFDKPFISSPSTHVAPQASQQSFGHTGFTGTMIWIDPKYNLVYIFLSNRVHPTATPNKLASLNIRTDIQSLIYKSMK